MKKTSYDELNKTAKRLRRELIKLFHETNSSHIGSGFSIIEILLTLYFKIADTSKDNFTKREHDRIILSKGHAALALYGVLKEKGFLSEKDFQCYHKNDQYLCGHPNKGTNGVEVSSGSLGHGLPMAVGFAMANKLDNIKNHIFVILGDGECNEGTVYESAIIASRLKLDNLTIIVDCNNLQGYDCTKDICPPEYIKELWKAVGAYLIEIDGHNFEQLEKALDKTNVRKNLIKVVMARTIKGKGVSFMENKLEWHYKSPNDEQMVHALKELE
jgi:transketolase